MNGNSKFGKHLIVAPKVVNPHAIKRTPIVIAVL